MVHGVSPDNKVKMGAIFQIIIQLEYTMSGGKEERV